MKIQNDILPFTELITVIGKAFAKLEPKKGYQ